MSKEQKTLKSCYILDRLREWFELYGNQNHQRAEEELHLAIDELYEYQQKDRQLADLEAKLAEKEKEIEELKAQRHIYLTRSVDECNRITMLELELQHKDQDKISFAIAELEKVKDWCKGYRTEDEFGVFTINVDDELNTEDNLLNFIDNQIKQLKEKNNGTKICQN